MKTMVAMGRAAVIAGAIILMVGVLEAAGPPIPRTPAAVTEVLHVQEFTLDAPYRTDWRKERPWVQAGTVLVLKVDPDLVYPRQSAEPVLYAGEWTAERINGGYPSGILVVVVPGKLDLDKDLIWFGSPELPERVDLEMIRREHALALDAKIRPVGAAKVKAAAENASGKLTLRGRHALLRQVGTLILKHDPKDENLGRHLSNLKDVETEAPGGDSRKRPSGPPPKGTER
jgi:hypothetical protein